VIRRCEHNAGDGKKKQWRGRQREGANLGYSLAERAI
jgi:hypothetical protein